MDIPFESSFDNTSTMFLCKRKKPDLLIYNLNKIGSAQQNNRPVENFNGDLVIYIIFEAVQMHHI